MSESELLEKLLAALKGHSDTRSARLALGRDALISVTEAATLLPCRDAAAVKWMRSRGLVRTDPELGDAVLWGDVVDAWGRAPRQEAQPKTRGRLTRAAL